MPDRHPIRDTSQLSQPRLDIHRHNILSPQLAPASQPLVHLLDKSIDVLLPVSKITSLDEVLELPCSEATSWV
jgi:hypothetical protein